MTLSSIIRLLAGASHLLSSERPGGPPGHHAERYLGAANALEDAAHHMDQAEQLDQMQPARRRSRGRR